MGNQQVFTIKPQNFTMTNVNNKLLSMKYYDSKPKSPHYYDPRTKKGDNVINKIKNVTLLDENSEDPELHVVTVVKNASGGSWSTRTWKFRDNRPAGKGQHVLRPRRERVEELTQWKVFFEKWKDVLSKEPAEVPPLQQSCTKSSVMSPAERVTANKTAPRKSLKEHWR